jgi:sugar phosphate isomerase/epimerase
MTSPFSFITAGFVARQLGYRMELGWNQGDEATNAWFSPPATFHERFESMLLDVKALGFSSIDLWAAHLHFRWATPQQVESAQTLLAKHGFTVRSYAGWVPGGTPDLVGACRLCSVLGVPIIAGIIECFAQDRAAAVAVLREHGVAYAIENHAEKNAAEMWARLGASDEDVVGVALDTGWCATQGWDPQSALAEFAPRIKAVHLKDVKARRTDKTGLQFVDQGHETCRLGDGIVPIKAILETLREKAFRGPMCVEHEPELFDPRQDLRESRERVEQWWAASPARGAKSPELATL